MTAAEGRELLRRETPASASARPDDRRTWRGFTLVEVAILLVVIGLVVSGGLLAINPLLQSGKTAVTQAKLEKIESALRLYAIRNGCLPCPADGSIATGDADFGEAQDDTGGVYGTPCTADDCITANAVVPWVTLGLAENDITDSWGNRVSYVLDTAPSAVQSQNPTTPCPALGVETSYGGVSICRATTEYPDGDFAVEDADGNTITNAALFVLISHGPNGLGARAATTGTARAAPAGTSAENNNATATSPFTQDSLVGTSGDTYFDDIVLWQSAPVFVQQCGASVCGN